MSFARAAPSRPDASSDLNDESAVVFVVFQTGNAANGGVESITQVIEGLSAVRPVVVTQMETPVNRRWAAAGATVHVCPVPEAPGRLERVRALLRVNRTIRQLVRSSRARVVHCNDIRALWFAGPGARSAGASIVFNIRDVKADHERYGWNWRLAQIADRILVLSADMRETLSRRLPGATPGLRASTRVEHIYSVVDLERMRPISESERAALRQRLGIRRDELAIAYVATVAEKKNQFRFLEEAGPLLKSRLPHARVHFIGDFDPEHNEYAGLCLDAARRLQIDERVVFEGYAPEVAEWYRACDVTVLASRREGLARCMIESIACGTPVISFDVSSAGEILVSHQCGIVVRQGDYRSMVEQIALLQDADLRRKMGTAGRAAAEELFQPDRIVARYESLYAELAASSRGARASHSLRL